MAKDRRGKSPAFLRELRRKYGLGEFKKASTTRRKKRGVPTYQPVNQNAKKVAKRSKSTRRAGRKRAKSTSVGLKNSMNWSL